MKPSSKQKLEKPNGQKNGTRGVRASEREPGSRFAAAADQQAFLAVASRKCLASPL